MAFPVIEATSSGATSGEATSLAMNLPASYAAGDLIVFFISHQDGGNGTTPSGWTKFKGVDENSNLAMYGIRKILDGGESSTVSVTIPDARSIAYNGYRITGFDTTTPIESGTKVNTDDPPSLTPSWGSKDTLWIAVSVFEAASGDTGATGFPSSYTDGLNAVDAHNPGNANGVGLASAVRELAASSEDPGTFTVDGSTLRMANTFAIQNLPVASTLALAQGSFSLTGFTLAMTIAHILALVQGAYALTGQALSFTLALRWNNESKTASSFSNGTKTSSSWVNESKHSSTFVNGAKT